MDSPVEQHKTVLKPTARSRYSSSASVRSSTTSIRSKIRLTKESHKKDRTIKVFDANGEDVTPGPLTRWDPDAKLFYLEEVKEQLESGVSIADTETVPHHTKAAAIAESETALNTGSAWSLASDEHLPVLELQKPQTPYEEIAVSATEEMLDELVHVYLKETETICLLDILPAALLYDDEDAEALKESNPCSTVKGKTTNRRFAERAMQTLKYATKNQAVQVDLTATAEAESMATNSDIHNSMNSLTNMEPKSHHFTENLVRTISTSICSSHSSSMASTPPPDSLPAVDGPSGPDLQTVLNSLLPSLRIIERIIVTNSYIDKLAAFLERPLLPDRCVRFKGVLCGSGGPESEMERTADTPLTPALRQLWSFSCELTAGCEVTSISWNPTVRNVLAVGYNNSANSKKTPGLICVWSIKNIEWPESVIYSHSEVTSVDFSSCVPSQLGVGMMDGTVAIYDVVDIRCEASSEHSANRHMHRVCQVSWNKETLVSISVDGLVKSWLLDSKTLESTDLLQLKHVSKGERETEVIEAGPEVAAGLCLHFHPVVWSTYLAGTRQGVVDLCSIYMSFFVDTFLKHACSVNSVAWSPFSPDLFLSGSSDYTIHLWSQKSPDPVLGFRSSETEVLIVCWSPKWPTVFAALRAEQLEIWDLKTCTLNPAVVLDAPEALRLTSVQFCPNKDALVLGDSQGVVTVHQLKNFNLSQGQVVRLEDVV